MTKVLGVMVRPSCSSKGHTTIVAAHLIEHEEATRGARAGTTTDAAHLRMHEADTPTTEEKVEAGTPTGMESGIGTATGHGMVTDGTVTGEEASVHRTVGRTGHRREAISAHRETETTDVSAITGTGTSRAGRSAISRAEQEVGEIAMAAVIAVGRAPIRMALAQVDGKNVATLSGAMTDPVNPVKGASNYRHRSSNSKGSQRA